MSAIIALLFIGACIWNWRQSACKEPRINTVLRSGFQPPPMQRAVIDEILRREHDRIDAYQSRCYREHIASCARKSQHQS